MATTPLSPVQIVQELIAMYTTRKEAAEKLGHPDSDAALAGRLSAAIKQSDDFIAALLNELSNFGDGVQPEVDRQNDYFLTYKEALPSMETMSHEERAELWESLESSLRSFYGEQKADVEELPESIVKLLTEQRAALV